MCLEKLTNGSRFTCYELQLSLAGFGWSSDGCQH